MSLALHEIADDYLVEFERLAYEPDSQKAADLVECVGEALKKKGANVALFIRNEELTVQAIKTEEERLAKLRQVKERGIERLKQYLAANMKRTGIDRIDHPLLSIKFKRNPPAVDVLCEAQIPPRYWRVPPAPPPTLDKKAIAADLKAGQDVPGAQLTQSERLVIE